MLINIVCKGHRFSTGDGGFEYSHRTEPIETFTGDVGDWAATGPNANKRITRLRGNEYERPRDAGQEGRAEAARRAGTATPDQLRLLRRGPSRINFTLTCPTCDQNPRVRQENLFAVLDRVAEIAKAGGVDLGVQRRLVIDNDTVTLTVAEVREFVRLFLIPCR
ncbi:Hypothetical protein MUW33_2792 [Mycobacterium canetti]|uniref:hypothetical protein n=1 Tax=Mycobacterium canetti TaxID=78331 RepID=UPI002D79793C|nr:hypothetical protein [Mycobacterium canetti]WRO42742.1 Hypothetical protein MUW33_2792 [Mycobacterium canetti]